MSEGILNGNVRGIWLAEVTINPASVAAATTAEQTFTVPGLKSGDLVFVNKPSLNAGLGVAGARVSAADTLAISFVNASAGAVDAGSEAWLVLCVRKSGAFPGGVSD